MPYIKLLTVLAGLALLTACGGAAAPKTDNTSGDTNTGEVNTTDCTATPFDTNCDAVESAITSRQTTCFASATANRRCGVVIAGACVANPFRAETACMADTYLPARIAECIKGGEADEGKCATITTDAEKNTMLTSCLKNPFDIVCKMTVADFATYTDTARMNRLDFCDDNANVANTLCTDNNVVIICGIDPFNAICFTGDTYLSPRITDCIKAENTEAEKCNTLLSDSTMNTAITACLTNPFTPSCEASESAFNTHANTARMNRESFCDMAGNDTKAFCMGENLMGVCGIDPFNASCTDAIHPVFKAYYANSARTPERTLHPTPTTTASSGAFVEGTATSLPTDDLTFTANDNFSPVTVRLKKATTGDDGFAFMYGIIGNSPRFRTGLLSGTDLGPALSGTSTATWTGSLHFANTVSGVLEFALDDETPVTVDFDNGTIKTDTITVQTNRTVAIDGLFRAGSNNNDLPYGILGGKVVYNFVGDIDVYDLPLIGLIGTEGVIGVFHGGTGVVAGGGFQASPSE